MPPNYIVFLSRLSGEVDKNALSTNNFYEAKQHFLKLLVDKELTSSSFILKIVCESDTGLGLQHSFSKPNHNYEYWVEHLTEGLAKSWPTK
jgi:hypothetical protein